MSRYSAIIERDFKKGTDGRTLFFPFSMFGGGRVLEDPDAERRLRVFLAVFQRMSVVVLLAVIFFAEKYILYVFAACYAVYYAGVFYLLSGSPVSLEPLTAKEYIGRVAADSSVPLLWFTVIWSSSFTVLGAIFLLPHPEFFKKVLGLVCCTLLGYYALISVWALQVRSERQQNT